MSASSKPAAQPSPLAHVVRSEAFPGLLLIAAAIVALLASNLLPAGAWRGFWETPLSLRVGDLALQKPLQHWINDGLMALFFFFVGLEIKHEVLDGQLRTVRQALLPASAALGGMLVPALVYSLTVAAHGAGAAKDGWGIPMSTDIAFALGVLTLLGKSMPPGLKVFLASLAIVDDLGAVLVIAIFYTEAIAWPFLLGGLLVLAASYAANRLGARQTWPYAVFGLLIWFLFLESGVHATIAGVALALTVPARRHLDEHEFSQRVRQLMDEFDHVADPTPRTNDEQLALVHEVERHAEAVQAPLQRMGHGLEALVSFWILPLFALANAGVDVVHATGSALSHPAAHGVFLGLLLGKPAGILLASWLAVRLLRSPLPPGATWAHLHGASWLAGIGFTMSLFIAGLAFPGHGGAYFAAKVAILGASAVAATVGFLVLRRLRGAGVALSTS